MSLEGKVVLVTGGARGMGREYVRGFLKEGAKVVATARSWTPSGISGDDEDFFAEVVDNPNVLAEVMDLTIDSHVKRVYEAAIAKFGTIDVIVNNAAMRTRDIYKPAGQTTILDTELGDWFRMFDTNVFGTWRVVKMFSQPMLEKKQGSIINVSSTGPGPHSLEGPYQPSKAAETVMSHYLAHELKPYNIAVNVLLPGFTRTTGSDEQSAARAALAGGKPPALRRLRADSGVPLALFLAQQDASGETGGTFNVMKWNEDNGLGGFEAWGFPADVEAARAAGTL
jgi:NAD(P)-dependent dehydrogenase (short-subunit alcohol dehydrogenase family)